MYFDFNVTGPERKRLVQAISQFTGADARYLAAPTFAYQVDRFNIGKTGVVSVEGEIGQEELAGLMETLADQGFVSQVSDSGSAESAAEAPAGTTEEAVEEVPEEAAEDAPDKAADAPQEAASPKEALAGGDTPEAPQEAPVGETCGLCVELPRDRFTDAALENLRKLVDSKAALIRKALGAGSLDITVTDERVSFPWFRDGVQPEDVTPITRFVERLAAFAMEHKRVTAKEKQVDNEKYAFRCFLLRLGFIGAEYKADRKALLRNLSGSAAFKSGDRREKETEGG